MAAAPSSSSNYYIFRSPYEFDMRDPVTLVELRMRDLSYIIRQKPRWWKKVNDALVAKWRAEMIKFDRLSWRHQNIRRPRDDPITHTQLDYVFAELKYAASKVESTTGIHSTSVYGVHKSFSPIPTDLRQALVRGVAILESVPDEEKDWHPGSENQVLDLVHPALYCLRIGTILFNRPQDDRSSDPLVDYTWDEYRKTRKDFDEYARRNYTDVDSVVSQDYQWLPTDFTVATTGEVTRQGYINNRHPIEHRVLYPPITSILQRFIPMFETVLSDALSPEPPLLIRVDPICWYEHFGGGSDSDDSEEEYQNHDDWYEAREPFVPEPPSFKPPSTKGRVQVNLKGRTLQVIVKLANIVLTPEKPEYPGGAWHVEGMLNERIVATGLYYYACENITESRLAFRTQLNQELGHIVAVDDKCVAFPKLWQHCVEPFELADRSRPGVRKILCFFLVDPYRRVHSTSDVPPQQRSWYEKEMERVPALREHPTELYDMIASYALVGTISREEAEEVREELIEERSDFVVQQNEDVYELNFSLCEH
ncbi:hypothetical protein C8Q74DRAFT_1459944 [Fomes fomentarius]|nr:hypothetical protein C8Q74DRAFT_1459944 [Fomes fomentarius]